MASEFRFKCPLPNGLHARPASVLAENAASWNCQISLTNLRTGEAADGASVLELVAAGVLHGDECLIECRGSDEELACAELAEFVEQYLSISDVPLPVPDSKQTGRVPPSLVGEAVDCIVGFPASPGIGQGSLVHLQALHLPDNLAGQVAEDQAREQELADKAFATAITQLKEQSGPATTEATEIRRAMVTLAGDPALRRLVHESVEQQNSTAAQAVVEAIARFSRQLGESDSEYLRARAADLQDVGLRLLAQLPGAAAVSMDLQLERPSVVVARNLSTTQMLNLDRSRLAGLILGEAGTTSHVVILARSFGIPCVARVETDNLAGLSGEALIDGTQGFVALQVTPAVERYCRRELSIARRLAERSAALRDVPAATTDGRRVEVATNITSAEETENALAGGAEGVGLFRTELLFSTAKTEPTEDGQYEVYAAAAKAFEGRPVVIRTLDAGGDKPLAYLPLPAEFNPFLGFRGIRVYRRHEGLFRRQLRAIVRASARGNVWVMAPMVSSVAEARWFREQVAACQAELAAEGLPFNPEMPVGIMVEVPSAALLVDKLCAAVDFFSVGTNDLTQYVLALDRGNRQVTGLYEELNPALLRLAKQAVDAAHAHGKWIGLCGELARNPRYTPLLIGLGFDELSVSVPAVPAVKAAVAASTGSACRELSMRALECADDAEVRAEIDAYESRAKSRQLLSPELIEVNSDCRSKAEAIRELCALSLLAGRCRDVNGLEAAVWAREETYSTGLGYGFAVPHCKSDAVVAGSLGVLKLAEPVEWGAVDNQPVDMVIMLAMPAADPNNLHLLVFAALARKLTHADFRAGLRAHAQPDSILAYLERELELAELEG